MQRKEEEQKGCWLLRHEPTTLIGLNTADRAHEGPKKAGPNLWRAGRSQDGLSQSPARRGTFPPQEGTLSVPGRRTRRVPFRCPATRFLRAGRETGRHPMRSSRHRRSLTKVVTSKAMAGRRAHEHGQVGPNATANSPVQQVGPGEGQGQNGRERRTQTR